MVPERSGSVELCLEVVESGLPEDVEVRISSFQLQGDNAIGKNSVFPLIALVSFQA